MRDLSKAELADLRRCRDTGRLLIEGVKLLREAAACGWKLDRLVVTPATLRNQSALIESLNPAIVSLTDQDGMRRLSEVKTPPELIGVAAVPHVTFAEMAALPLIVCLDGVSDPGNLGTIARTADWFGVAGLLVGNGGVDPFNGKAVRAGMGSLFRLKVWQSADLPADLARLKKAGLSLIVADPRGPGGGLPESRRCLVLGSESHGVSPAVRELADAVYVIPGRGGAESLNVAVSAGIALYDLTVGGGNR